VSSPSWFKRVLARLTYDRSIGFGLEHLGLTTVRYPRLMALGVLLFSVLCFTQIPKANVDGDLLRVYAHSGHYYDAYEHLSETFGTFENDLYVLVNSERLAEPEIIEQVRSLAFELELNEFAVGTMSPFTLRKPSPYGGSEPAVPEGLQTADEVAFALMDLQQNDPMMRNLITPDLNGVVLIMFPNQDVVKERGAKAMIENLRQTIVPFQSADISIEITGPPVWTTEMLNAAVDDQVKFTVYGFALGSIIALLALRSIAGALIVAATPFLAVMWAMGMILLFFGSFSFLTIIVAVAHPGPGRPRVLHGRRHGLVPPFRLHHDLPAAAAEARGAPRLQSSAQVERDSYGSPAPQLVSRQPLRPPDRHRRHRHHAAASDPLFPHPAALLLRGLCRDGIDRPDGGRKY